MAASPGWVAASSRTRAAIGQGRVIGIVSSTNLHLGAVAADVAHGQACDVGQAFGVEQDEQADDQVLQAQAVIVPEPPCVLAALLGMVPHSGTGPVALVGDVQAADVPTGDRPAQEMIGFPGIGEALARHLCVQARLRQGGRRKALAVQHVHQVHRGQHVSMHVIPFPRRGVLFTRHESLTSRPSLTAIMCATFLFPLLQHGW